MSDQASLPLDHLLRLQALTRDYARLTQTGAGLGKVLGGVFLLALVAVELAGHPMLVLLGAFAPLPAGTAVAMALLPFLWLGAREVLGRWWYQRHGVVVESAGAPLGGRLAAARVLLPCLILLGLVPVLRQTLPLKGLRAALVVALAAGLAWAWPRIMHRGRLERVLGILLFLGPALLGSGVQLAAGDALFAFPLVGAVAVVLGVREHLAFRRLERELAERP